MSKICDENYFTIQGFMVNKLKLKGNELLIYAIIYCFSQTEGQKFTGSLQYLADWTNSSKRSVLNNLQSLVEKQLIVKDEYFYENNKNTVYKIAINGGTKTPLEVVKKVHQGSEKNSPGVVKNFHQGGEKSSPNNKIYNKIYNKPPIVPLNGETSQNEIIKKIIDYMNFGVYEKNTWLKQVKHNYKYSNTSTRKKIEARLEEGYTLNDFKDVIFYCYREWVNDPIEFKNGKMSDTYYRPSTMFNPTNFENYLESYRQGLNE